MSNKTFPVAILQGRLSQDVAHRYQFFPKDEWRNEFVSVHTLGFEGIEWLVDPKEWKDNPIFSPDFDEAEKLGENTSIPIVSVCADWFMEVCIWEGDPEMHRENIRSLFPRLQKTSNKLLLLPLLETHSIFESDIQNKVVAVLKPLVPELESRGIRIAFETELTAPALISFLSKFESDAFGVYYDIGNCTSYGFNCAEDIRVLGKRIKGVHVKDRKVGSTATRMLGEGDADFKSVIEALQEIDWEGTLVLQAWRGENYLDDARTQLNFIRSFFEVT